MVEVKEMRRESNIREPPTILLQYRLGPCSHLGPGVSPRHHGEYMYETEDRHNCKWMPHKDAPASWSHATDPFVGFYTVPWKGANMPFLEAG